MDISQEKNLKQNGYLPFENLPIIEPPSWLVKDLICERGVTIIGGETGSQKSFFAMEIASSIINGRKVAGQFDVLKQGKVLYIDVENDRGIVKQRFEGLGEIPHDTLWFQDDVHTFDLRTVETAKELTSFADILDPVLVIIDTLRRAWSGDENKSEDVNNLFMSVLAGLAQNRAVILVHHTKKRQQDRNSSDELGDLRGSSDIAAFASNIITLRKLVDVVNIYVRKSRFSQPIKPFSIRLIMEGDSIFRYEYQGDALEDMSGLQNCVAILKSWLTETFPSGTVLKTKEILSGFKQKHDFKETAVFDSISFLRKRGMLRREKRGEYTLIHGDDSLATFV